MSDQHKFKSGRTEIKIKIGPFIHHYTTSSLEQDYLTYRYGISEYFNIRESQYTRMDRSVIWVLDRVQDLLHITINKIQAKRERKVKIHLDRYDTWNMDGTLSMIIAPMLKQLKDTKHGAPNVEPEDVPEELRPTPEEIKAANLNGDTDEKWFDRWDYVIDEMIFAFEHIADNDWEESFRSGDVDITWEPQNVNGKVVDEDDADFFEMKKGPKDTFKVDTDGIQAVYDRIDNGTRLFGKYYRGLWT